MTNIQRSALLAAVALMVVTAPPALAGPERPPVCPYMQGCVHDAPVTPP